MKRMHLALAVAFGLANSTLLSTVLGQDTSAVVGDVGQQLSVTAPAKGDSPVPKASDGNSGERLLDADNATKTVASQAAPASLEVNAAISQARSLSLAFRHASAKALPSVVMILTRMSDEGDEDANAIRDMLDSGANFDSVGSGVIVSSDGLIITNQHVVADAKRIQVRLADGRRFNVGDVKGDPNSDIAILRIDGEDLPVAEVGDSSDLFVGDWVLAIGSPFTFQSSVSAGIISGKDRWHALSKDVRGLFLQVDAAINPGNSGGALVDLDGKLIGINTAITSRNGGFQGIGFSIPISRASWIMDELLNHGRVRRAYAGVGTSDIPFSVAQSLGLRSNSGAYVRSVRPGFAAQEAGLEIGDIILTYDGVQVDSAGRLAELIQQSRIDQPLPIVIQRGDERKTLTFRPAEKQ